MIVSGVPALPFDDSGGFSTPPAFGPYRVLHQIGSGVLGPVFRTFEPVGERLVAVKAFRLDVVPEVSAQLAEALKELAEITIDHPVVIPAVDAGLEGTTAFLASAYVAADTLDVALRTLAPASLEDALPLLRQMADAIDAAADAGLGHGALHPRDVFVKLGATGALADATVRVGGFGVVAALEALRIPAPARRPYAAPEREQGDEWDIRADVFSLGVIAHELLTGQHPAATADAEDELPLLRSSVQDDGVTQILAGAIGPDANRRFSTATVFIDALAAELDPVERPVRQAPRARIAPPVSTPSSSLAARVAATGEAYGAFADTPLAADVSPVSTLPGWESRDRNEARVARPEPEAFMHDSESRGGTGVGALAAMLVVGLTLGAGLGYWWRGPASASVVKDAPSAQETAARPIAEEPIGTEVLVPQTAEVTPTPILPSSAIPQPPADAPAPPAANGRVLVRSVPSGAAVSVDGRAHGTTRATIRDLPFGSHTVAVSKAGYRSREERIAVSEDVPAREVTLELTAVAPAAAKVSAGSVLVETRPAGATVMIDGRVVGKSPMRVPELAAGSHTIRVDLAGRKRVTTTVVVRAGQETAVRLSLEVQ